MEIVNKEKFEQVFPAGKEFFQFVAQYRATNPDYIQSILEWFEWYEENNVQFDSSADIPYKLLELLSKFQIINSAVDPYRRMYHWLKELSFLNGNCCEVASGPYPRLAELVLPELRQNNSKLTIYEPKIILDELEGTQIIKDKFTKKANLEDIDTIFGLYPCAASIPMIDKSIAENKNLLLAFCACDHSTPQHQKWIGDYWAVDVCMDYREKYGDEIQIMQWPAQYDIPYPVMVRKKQK